jgi:hypothetical protein
VRSVSAAMPAYGPSSRAASGSIRSAFRRATSGSEEGSEHYLFYELEERLQRPFTHGFIVGPRHPPYEPAAGEPLGRR